MTVLALASSMAASLIVWPTTANAAVQLQGSFSERVLKPHFTGLCAPGVEGNQCGVIQLAGLGPADFTYLFGPAFEPTATMGCYFVDGTFTLALQSDGSSVTGPLTGVFCQPGLSGPGGGKHSYGNPSREDDTIAFTSGTGQFSELSGTATFRQSGSGALPERSSPLAATAGSRPSRGSGSTPTGKGTIVRAKTLLVCGLPTLVIGAGMDVLVGVAATRASIPAPELSAAFAAVTSAALAWPAARFVRRSWLEGRYGAGARTPADVARRTSLFLLAGLLCTLIAGCGGDSERATSTADAAKTAAPPNLEQYLMQDDEVPGLEPIESPRTDSGPPFDLPEDGAERLRRSGYISTTYQPAEGDRSSGVSSALLFETEAGARDWMAYETSDEAIRHQIPGAKIKRFQVLDVPGAHGWTGPDLHGNAIGQVYWTQGRCMMLIGLEVEGPRVERLSAGAKAIYERTGGTCPD